MGRYSNQGDLASDLLELLDMTPEPGPVIERLEKQLHHRLHAEEVAQLITEYKSGVKVKELAVRYHISRDTVIKHAKRAGEVRHRYPLCKEPSWSKFDNYTNPVTQQRRWLITSE